MIDFKEFVDRFWEQGYICIHTCLCISSMDRSMATAPPIHKAHHKNGQILHSQPHSHMSPQYNKPQTPKSDLYVRGDSLVPYLPDKDAPPEGSIETAARRCVSLIILSGQGGQSIETYI